MGIHRGVAEKEAEDAEETIKNRLSPRPPRSPILRVEMTSGCSTNSQAVYPQRRLTHANWHALAFFAAGAYAAV